MRNLSPCYLMFIAIFFTYGMEAQVDNQYDIYAVNTYSGIIKRITTIPDAGEFNATWSPYWNKIAHDVVSDTSHDIYVTRVWTGVSTPLVGAEGGNDAAWSPNGRYIAFDRFPANDNSVYYVKAYGGKRKLIKEDALDPHWSPSGKRIVYTAPDGIRAVRRNGTDDVLVASFGGNPVWSRNGQWIAFSDGVDIWKVRVNYRGIPFAAPINVTNNPPGTFSSQPSWSRNGRKIVTASNLTGNYDIMTIPSMGGSLTLLADLGMNNDYDPCYSKSGRWVAFSGFTRLETISMPSSPPNKKLTISNYPNPFTHSTNIRFKVLETSNVQISIYDYTGKMLKTLVNEEYQKGDYQTIWDGKSATGNLLPSGIYIYQLINGNHVESHQMILLRN